MCPDVPGLRVDAEDGAETGGKRRQGWSVALVQEVVVLQPLRQRREVADLCTNIHSISFHLLYFGQPDGHYIVGWSKWKHQDKLQCSPRIMTLTVIQKFNCYMKDIAIHGAGLKIVVLFRSTILSA